MRFNVITLFPEAIAPYLEASILGAAQTAGLFQTALYPLRQFATDSHQTVDDTPYGGGAGMVLKTEPIDRALQAVAADLKAENITGAHRVVVLSAKGTPFTQQRAATYAQLEALTLICGRYEGIDQRVIDHLAHEEVSVGPYVLAGGEIGSLAIVESVARLIPGVLGNPESLTHESHTTAGSLEYPQYTKPADYNGWVVPEVLLSGDHGRIAEWRTQAAQKRADES